MLRYLWGGRTPPTRNLDMTTEKSELQTPQAPPNDRVPAPLFRRKWQPIDASGHPQIDAEHRALVEAMAEIGGAIAENRDVSTLYALLKAVVHSCITHFANEEAILYQAKFP